MSSDLEEVFNCIHNAQVPPLWGKAYPSQKALGAWTRDLVMRVEQFSLWATTTHPPVLFWLSGFTFPTGFLTAVLQTAARKNNVINACFQILIRLFNYTYCTLFVRRSQWSVTSQLSLISCAWHDVMRFIAQVWMFVHASLCRCLWTPCCGIFTLPPWMTATSLSRPR